MEELAEKRTRVRTPFVTEAIIISEAVNLKADVELSNISISGMFVETDQVIEKGTLCDVQIIINGKHSRLIIDDIQATVVRHEEGGLGLNFTSDMEWFVLFKIYTRYAKGNYR
ncbi:MAG: PilZ domain-containing protein [Thermodesulfobacteriota bacterium]